MSGSVLVLGANGRLGQVRDDSGLHYPSSNRPTAPRLSLDVARRRHHRTIGCREGPG